MRPPSLVAEYTLLKDHLLPHRLSHNTLTRHGPGPLKERENLSSLSLYDPLSLHKLLMLRHHHLLHSDLLDLRHDNSLHLILRNHHSLDPLYVLRHNHALYLELLEAKVSSFRLLGCDGRKDHQGTRRKAHHERSHAQSSFFLD